MTTPITIEVRNAINTTYCIDVADGEKIYELLSKALKESRSVVLSFSGIELIITAFLNTAVGKLYKDFSEEFISKHLSVSNLQDDFLSVWDKVVEGAPRYYANKVLFDKNIREVIEE